MDIILQRVSEIQSLIGEDSLNRATLRLMDFCHDFSQSRDDQHAALVIRSNFSGINQETVALGISESLQKRRNELVLRMMNLIDKVQSDFKAPSEYNRPAPSKISKVSDDEVEESHERNNRKPRHGQVIISLENLEKKFEGFSLEVEKFDLKEGEIIGVVGENGSGKSTFLKILSGGLSMGKGELHFFNEHKDPDWIQLKSVLFYLPQVLRKMEHVDVRTYLSYVFALNGVKGEENKELIDKVVFRMGLEDHVEKTWDELSGGYQLRLELARAFGLRPRLLILDEPLANLDVITQSRVLKDFLDLSGSVKSPSSLIISSQHLVEIEHIADRIIYFENGKVRFFGTKEDLGKLDDKIYLEFISDAGIEQVKSALDPFAQDLVLRYHGFKYELVISGECDMQAVLNAVNAISIEFEYHRNTTKSIKRFFSNAESDH